MNASASDKKGSSINSATDTVAAIDAIVHSAMVAQQLPGVSIVVASASNVILARGYGRRNVGESLDADADTIYSIASISKQFTVAAIMRLAERGLLSINDRVNQHLPWLTCDDAIELRHVMTHTSGIRDYFPLEDLDRIGMSAASAREIGERMLANGSAFAPGDQYQYCNTGYVLLGAIVEQVAGMSYANYLAAAVFDPLGMSRTGVDDLPVIRANVAVGHTSFVLGPWELARDYHPSWEFGTGGLFSTAVDLLKWNLALRAGTVVSPASLVQMTTPAILTSGEPVNYGLGLAVSKVAGIREVRHTGGLPGMSTDNATYPELGIDIIVLVNHDGRSTYFTITRPILALLLSAPHVAAAPPDDKRSDPGPLLETAAPDWIRAAARGDIGGLPLAPKFARFLRPDRRARYADLREYGDVTAIRLLDTGRRDPETTLSYCVDFERTRLLAVVNVLDNGTLSGLDFRRWDNRA